MPFVLDASVAACWCFHDEKDARADFALERLNDERATSPLLWWFEVRNVVTLATRRGRITYKHLNWFLDRLERFPVHLATLPRQHDVLELAQKHRLTFYDATYLELAKRENLSLATLDRNLAQAASAEGVPLLGVPQ